MQTTSTVATRTLVLLPGLDGTEVFFAPFLAALPPSIRPVVVTYPAAGRNGYADLLPLVLDAVRDLDEFYVLGWSFSGPLALMLASALPEKVRGVVLCASFVRPPLQGLSWMRFAVVPPVVRAIRFARRAPAVLLRRWTPELKQAKSHTWASVPSAVLARRARAILAVDAREALRRCPTPVLYVAGSRDTVVPRRNADDICRERPSTMVVTIDGPHLALYTNPAAAVRAVLEFADACRCASADGAVAPPVQ